MSVCDIRCFNESGKAGYVALLDSVSDGKLNAVRYNGTDFGFNFHLIALGELNKFKVKTVRSAKDFGRYIKEVNAYFMVSPIQVQGLVFDIPYIYYGGKPICRWQPIFEKGIGKNSFNILSEGMIVEYYYQQPIFISVLDAKRHIPKVNMERLLVNTATGVVTRTVSKAEATEYFEGVYHLVNGDWCCDNVQRIPIAGYKLR